MWNRLAVKLTVYLLSKGDLSIQERSQLTAQLLSSVGGLPIRDIIGIGENGSMTVRGQEVDIDLAKKLQGSAQTALNNMALSLVHEQARYQAITTGFLEADSEKTSFFGKAAIWYADCEIMHLKKLAQMGGEVE